MEKLGKLYYKEDKTKSYEVIEHYNNRFVLIGNEYVPIEFLNLDLFKLLN